MGIPLYFHTIVKAYRGILHTAKPRACDWYFMDFNGVIHQAAQTVLKQHCEANPDGSIIDPEQKDEFERLIYHEVWNYTKKCINVADPGNNVGIFIDGVAPIAKINQQRKRRYLAFERHKLMDTFPVWDTNAISPGTAFMARLHAYMRSRIMDDPQQAKFMLSGADECGEGEHKIFAQIASIDASSSIFIHGLDADLIMLSLMSHHPNITLMREPTPPYHAADTADGYIYLDIDRLRSGLLQHLKGFGWPVTDEMLYDPYGPDARRIIETYVVVCFLLGNDFIPHAVTLSIRKGGYERILAVAKDVFQTMPGGAVGDNRVYVPFMCELITQLAKNEDDALWKVNQDYMHRKPSQKADKADAFPLSDAHRHPLAGLIYHHPRPKRWRGLYYKHLFFSKLNDTSVIANACENFVKGICWTYAYYKRLPKPYDWYYPHGYPPSLLDMANYLQGTPTHVWDSMQADWYSMHKRPKFLEPAVQLLCILPIHSMHLVPFKYQKFMTEHRYGIAYMFPCKYKILTYLHTHLWECVPVLPPLDIDWILSCTKAI